MTCGEKWSKQHKCPDKVPLHVLEEVLQTLQSDSDSEATHSSSSDEDTDEVFQLSQSAAAGVQGKKTLKLSGLVGKHEILILIDSGSSCTFISEHTAQALNCTVTPTSKISMTVANGQKMESQQQVDHF
jgi:hypothetical protein